MMMHGPAKVKLKKGPSHFWCYAA